MFTACRIFKTHRNMKFKSKTSQSEKASKYAIISPQGVSVRLQLKSTASDSVYPFQTHNFQASVYFVLCTYFFIEKYNFVRKRRVF